MLRSLHRDLMRLFRETENDQHTGLGRSIHSTREPSGSVPKALFPEGDH